MGEYVITQLKDGFKWTLVVSGKEIAVSRGLYDSYASCIRAIEDVKKLAGSPVKPNTPKLDFSPFIGRQVVVTEAGECLEYYHEMFKELGFKYPGDDKDAPTENEVYTVFNCGISDIDGSFLLAIKDEKTGTQHLIGYNGVRFI